MKTQMINFEGMALETLAEAANDAGEQVEKHAKSAVLIAVTAGKALLAAKSQVAHGEWLGWLGKNWNYSQQTASRYMTVAANYSSMGNLTDAKDINEALRMIADARQDAEPAIVPRAERKTGRVEVSEVGQTVVQADKPKPEKDDDPNPAPKTNTKHTPATAKAKEADRPATQVVTPVIVDEPKQWPDVSLEDLITGVIKKLEHDKQKKAAAKTLRKLADSLDPPAIGAPSIEAVQEWAQQKGISDFDADKFFAHYALAGWKYGKAKTPIKDWKLAAINAYSGGKGWAVDGANRLPF